jgi:DNA-binding SARP family transcriptional activator/TolB-like protein
MHRTTGRSDEAADADAGIYVFDLLGAIRLWAPDGSDVTPLGRKARGLLAYLALNMGIAVPRERLMALLWSERGEEQARASLRQCLYDLRPLATGDRPPLEIDRHHVALTAGRIETDVMQFETLVAGTDVPRLTAELDRLTRPLAEDLVDMDPAFDEWLAIERIRFEDRQIGELSSVVDRALAMQDAGPARDLAMALARRHPADEAVARLAMMASHACGQRDAIRRIYQRLEAALQRELDEVPSPETAQCLDRLMKRPLPIAAPAIAETGTDEPPMTVSTAPRRPAARWGMFASGAALVILAAAGVLWLRKPLPPAIPGELILVRSLQVPPNDPAAQALRQGLAASLARAVVGKDATLRIVDDRPDEDSARRAQFVLDGEAQTGGNELRATVSLHSTRSSEILWSGNFSGQAAEADALRQQAATQIGNALTCAFGARYRTGAPLADETIRLYLSACEAIAHSDPETVHKLLQRVIAAAPDFSRAWSDLATSSSYSAMDLDGPEAEAMQREARAQADHALELDPHNGRAYYARALSYTGLDHWLERVAVLRAGLAVEPDSPDLADAMADDLGAVGRQHEALGYARRSAALDPLSVARTASLVFRLAFDNRVREAQAVLTDADVRWPHDESLWGARLSLAARYGDPGVALAMLREPHPPGWMSEAHIKMWEQVMRAVQAPTEGNVEVAVATIRDRTKIADRSGDIILMQQFAVLGRLDDAFALADRHGGTIPDGETVWFRNYMAPFRADPRFMPLAYRQGLVDIWVKTGVWPDFCVEKTVPYDCKEEARRLMGENRRTENLSVDR